MRMPLPYTEELRRAFPKLCSFQTMSLQITTPDLFTFPNLELSDCWLEVSDWRFVRGLTDLRLGYSIAGNMNMLLYHISEQQRLDESFSLNTLRMDSWERFDDDVVKALASV